ncbi:PEGA domain-containing protein [Spirochaeta africana DSM 8902]|uniref:PEGA domain-containing protein n=2 Tax=Spirochaeta TaxID=146 RepID=H9UJP8_SPIAZ|nr:PEGA domain-containing protein [Spirochaeta africana DSM 8902]
MHRNRHSRTIRLVLGILLLWHLLWPAVLSATTTGEHQPSSAAVTREEQADPSAYGQLQISSDAPRTRVRLNGRMIGQTPLTEQDLPDGEHLLELSAEGYAGISRWILVEQGYITRVEASLRPLGGTVEIISNPPVTVQVTAVGSGRVLPGQLLAPGRHTLMIQAFGFQPLQKTIDLQDGQHLELQVQLEPAELAITDLQLQRTRVAREDNAALGRNIVTIYATAPGMVRLELKDAEDRTVFTEEVMLQQPRQTVLLSDPGTLDLQTGSYQLELHSPEQEVRRTGFLVVPGPTRILPGLYIGDSSMPSGIARPQHSTAIRYTVSLLQDRRQLLHRAAVRYAPANRLEVGLNGLLHTSWRDDTPHPGYAADLQLRFHPVSADNRLHASLVATATASETSLPIYRDSPGLRIEAAGSWLLSRDTRYLLLSAAPGASLSRGSRRYLLQSAIEFGSHNMAARLVWSGDSGSPVLYPALAHRRLAGEMSLQIPSHTAAIAIALHGELVFVDRATEWMPGVSLAILY